MKLLAANLQLPHALHLQIEIVEEEMTAVEEMVDVIETIAITGEEIIAHLAVAKDVQILHQELPPAIGDAKSQT